MTLRDITLQEIVDSSDIEVDKDINHTYLEVYDEILYPYQDQHVEILELGSNGGESLRLWDVYFESCNIIGTEILGFEVMGNLSKTAQLPNVEVYANTDAYSMEFYNRMKDRTFDLIFDDGSHQPAHQIFAMNMWFKLLNSGGLMIIEDIQHVNLISVLLSHMNELTPRDRVTVYDRRHIKQRFDDIIITIQKG